MQDWKMWVKAIKLNKIYVTCYTIYTVFQVKTCFELIVFNYLSVLSQCSTLVRTLL